MQIIRNLSCLPRAISTVLSVGKFDGVHLGHQRIISDVIARARELRVSSAVLTFDPHPSLVLSKYRPVRILTPLPMKLRLFESMGLDVAVVLPFTLGFASISPQSFVKDILVASLHVKEIHEGSNFRFGKSGAAGIAQLVELGRQYGVSVQVHSPVHFGHYAVSSSAIRKLLDTRNFELASLMLARPVSANALECQLS